MSGPEVDTESLETFLDGELSDEQMAAFAERIASDPATAAALDELKMERDARGQFFAALERHDAAEDVSVGRLLAGVEREIDREERRALARRDGRRMLRYVAGAAACVIFSFFAGWIGHGHTNILSLPADGLGVAERSASPDTALGDGTLVSNLISTPTSVSPGSSAFSAPGGVNVVLKNQSGQVIAVQPFQSLDEAREFTRDFARWQHAQQQTPKNDLPLVKDQF